MTATFNPDLSDRISRVRQTIGDTVVLKAQIQDETITAYLTTKNNDELGVSIQLAWDLSAKWAAAADTQIDNQRTRSSQISAQYRDLAIRLERQQRSSTAQDPVTGFAGAMVTGIGDDRGPNLTMPTCYE